MNQPAPSIHSAGFLLHLLQHLSGKLRHAESQIWRAEAAWRGVQMSGPVVFLGRPVITLSPGSKIILGGDNQLGSSVRSTGLGNSQPCVLRTLTSGARLELGRRVGLSGAAICAASSITIGEDTLIGAGAMIFDNDFHQPMGDFGWADDVKTSARPITIGRGCFIGTRSIIMKGVRIGDRAAVAAGAVVTGHVPTGMIAIGNPARNWPWGAVANA